MQKNQKAEVSQYSREVGRVPVEARLERLQLRRKELIEEKRKVEVQLSDVNATRLDETADLLKRRPHGRDTSQTVAGTMEIEARSRKQRGVLIRRKMAIEEELTDLKRQMHSRTRQDDEKKENKLLDVLLRIESLLLRMLEQMNDE